MKKMIVGLMVVALLATAGIAMAKVGEGVRGTAPAPGMVPEPARWVPGEPV